MRSKLSTFIDISRSYVEDCIQDDTYTMHWSGYVRRKHSLVIRSVRSVYEDNIANVFAQDPNQSSSMLMSVLERYNDEIDT